MWKWRKVHGESYVKLFCFQITIKICTFFCVLLPTQNQVDTAAWKVRKKSLREHYYWKNISAEVRTFARFRIHCLSISKGGKNPRSHGFAFHGTAFNVLLLFYCVEIVSRVSFHFTLPYSPWSSGAVERVGKIASGVSLRSLWNAGTYIGMAWSSISGAKCTK